MLLGACSKQDAQSSPEASVTAPAPAVASVAMAPKSVKPVEKVQDVEKPAKPEAKAADSESSVKSATSEQPAKEQAATTSAKESGAEDDFDASMVLARYQEGVHFERLKQPVKTVTGDKIEITEIFSYACIHCFHFETVVKAWKTNMPEGVEFVQMPAAFNAVWEHYARIFYTAKALGKLEELHPIIFKAMHVQRKRLREESEIAAVFAEAGIDEETFKSTFNSFGVSSQVQLADSRTRSFGTSGTPELIVNGTYRVTSGKAGSHEKMFDVADFLVDKIKSEKGVK